MISFDEVIAYIADYDPWFPRSIEAASAGEIAELEALTGGELPEAYHDFLAVMGRHTAWIDVQRLDFRIGTVLDYYRRDDALPVNEFLRIGSDTKDPSFNPHLQHSQHSLAASNAKVVVFPGCTPATFADITARYLNYVAGSLQEMVCRPAFRIFEIFGPERQPVMIRADVGIAGQIDQLEAMLLAEYGLEPVFWSNGQVRGYASPDIALEAMQFVARPLEILLRVTDQVKQGSIARSLAARLNARISTPSPPLVLQR